MILNSFGLIVHYNIIDWKAIIIDLLSAVNYLHKNNILHNRSP